MGRKLSGVYCFSFDSMAKEDGGHKLIASSPASISTVGLSKSQPQSPLGAYRSRLIRGRLTGRSRARTAPRNLALLRDQMP